MGLESNFQSRALEYLNSIPGCKAENVSGNAMQSGRPDINGCFLGRAFKLELKVPDHKNVTSKKQELELRKWATVGCSIGVLYSMAALKDWVGTMQHLCKEGYWTGEPWVVTKREEENGCESWFWV